MAKSAAARDANTDKVSNDIHNLLNSMVEARALQLNMRNDQSTLTDRIKRALEDARAYRSGSDIQKHLGEVIQQDIDTYSELKLSGSFPAKSNKLKEIATLALESLSGDVDISNWSEGHLDLDLPTLIKSAPAEGSKYSFGPDDRYWGTPKSTVWTYLCCQLLNVTQREYPHDQKPTSILYTIDTGSVDYADNNWLNDGVLTVPHSGYTFGGTRYTHPEDGPKLYGNPQYQGGESYDCSSWVGMWTTNATPIAPQGISNSTIDLALTYSRQAHGLPSSWEKWQAEDNNVRLNAAYAPVESLSDVKPGMVYVYNNAWKPDSPVEVADVPWKKCSGHTGMVVNLYPTADGAQEVTFLSANRSYEQGVDGVGYQSGYAAAGEEGALGSPCYLSANYAVQSRFPELMRDLTDVVLTWDDAQPWGSSQTQTIMGVIDSCLEPLE